MSQPKQTPRSKHSNKQPASPQRRNGKGRRKKRIQRGLIWTLAILMPVVAGFLIAMAMDLLSKPDTRTDVTPMDPPTTTQSQTAETTAPATSTTTSAPKTSTAKTSTTAVRTTAPTTYVPNTEGRYVQKGNPPWNLRLVNPWNPLTKEFFDTVPLEKYASGKEFDQRAMQALKDFIQAGKAYGVYAVSLYRSYELQTKLYNNEVQKQLKKAGNQAKAEELAATVVARPGTSEHHTGLAADILGSGYSDLVQSFGTSPAGKWLRENCAEYGFILRYPKEKEHITGVIYEPWHFRYVGKEHAKEIMSRGITLEEYLEEKGW